VLVCIQDFFQLTLCKFNKLKVLVYFLIGSGIGMCLSLLLYKEFLISEESIYTISVVFFSIAGFLEMRRRKKIK